MKKIYVKYIYIHNQSQYLILCRFCIDPFWAKSSFVASIEDVKPVLILNRFCIKAGFVA